jgi:hypothetical protein
MFCPIVGEWLYCCPAVLWQGYVFEPAMGRCHHDALQRWAAWWCSRCELYLGQLQQGNCLKAIAQWQVHCCRVAQ